MTTKWLEKLVECHPHKEDADAYPFSMSRLVKLINEARRAAFEECLALHDNPVAEETVGGFVTARTWEKAPRIREKIAALAAKEGET